MTNMFYRAFEDRYRGSFETIKSRLEIYLPFIKPLKDWDKNPCALDLGCGRGEWMTLLQEEGFDVQGVDLDEGMLEACRTRKLDVVLGDALEYIRKIKSDSLSVISAFHFVEHIPFDVLQEIVKEALRVLKPGGLLILETPNPESLIVGTSSFYLDPTHERPLPVALLTFITEYAKFDRIKALFLQEPPELKALKKIGISHLLEGVSPDYAVVSQKRADPAILALFEEPFAREYGARLLPLTRRYDEQVDAVTQVWQNKWNISQLKIENLYDRFNGMEAALSAAHKKVELLRNQMQSHAEWLQTSVDAFKHSNQTSQFGKTELLVQKQEAENVSGVDDTTQAYIEQLQNQAYWLENELEISKKKAHEQTQATQHWWQVSHTIERELQAVYASKSWRIAWPLRASMTLLKRLFVMVSTLLRKLAFMPKQAIKAFKMWIARKSHILLRMKRYALSRLSRYPRLKQFIRQFAMRSGLMKYFKRLNSLLNKVQLGPSHHFILPLTGSTKNLSSRATHLYHCLQVAIRKRNP